jgi:hypothetical protein
VAIGVAGTYKGSSKLNRELNLLLHLTCVISDHRVPENMASTVKALIRDGVSRGKIESVFEIKFGDEVSFVKYIEEEIHL